MRRVGVDWLEMLLKCLLPKDTSEAIAGDLEEELLQRAQSDSRFQAVCWYWRQVAGSVLLLACASMRKGGPATIGVAVVAYVAASLTELATGAVASTLLPLGGAHRLFVELIVGFAAFAAAGYFATGVRRGAAVPLAFMVVAVVVILILEIPDSVPYWYAVAFLIIAPAAPLAGALLFVRRSHETPCR